MSASDTERIRQALTYIPAHDRDTWLRMGMALKSELAEDGLPAWDEWSQGAENYNTRDTLVAWRSLQAEGGVTIGSLFFLAKQNGWLDDRTHRRPESDEIARKTAKRQLIALKGFNDKTALLAAKLWNLAKPTSADHAYLIRKGVAPCETLREINSGDAVRLLGYVPKCDGEVLAGRLLLVPIQIEGELRSIELIDVSGNKCSLPGRGTKAGGIWSNRPLPARSDATDTLILGEGVATVLSAATGSDHTGVAALSNTNLPKAAQSLRQRYPRAQIIVLADLDKASGKPDRFAVEAARCCAGKLAVPTFGSDRKHHQKDFNDMAIANGHAAVAERIGAAKPVNHGANLDSEKRGEAVVELLCAADLKPEAITWLWPGFIAQGKLSMLAGAPGTGKTTIALSLAATVSSAGLWPDGVRSQIGDVLIWSGEDGTKDVLVPRLLACGADSSRIRFIGPVTQAGLTREFDPAKDIGALADALGQHTNVALLIIDPIVSAVAGDSHKNAEVRRSLQPIVNLATDTGCAVIGITHFSKGTAGRDPLERLTGSLAFGALARCVLVTVKPNPAEAEVPKPRTLVRAKSNIGEDGGGFEYSLKAIALAGYQGITATQVVWGQAVSGTAQALLAKVEGEAGAERASALSEAKRFLVETLSDGPLAFVDVKAAAEAAGISTTTVRRAKNVLGVEARKNGMKGGWAWSLPRRCSVSAEDDQQGNLSIFAKVEHLRNEDEGNSGQEGV